MSDAFDTSVPLESPPRAKALMPDVAVLPAEQSAMVFESMALLQSLRFEPQVNAAALRPPPTGWDAAVADIAREVGELDDLRALVVRRVLWIGNKVGALQEWHADQRKRDPESVPASFVQGLADALDRSTSHVEQWLRIYRMKTEVKALIAAHPRIDGDFTALLAVAREGDPEQAANLVLAYQEGGRRAFDALADPLAARAKIDPGFRELLKSLHNPSHVLGGMAATTPLPADVRAQYAELEPYRTLGDARAASKQVAGLKEPRAKGRTHRALPSPPPLAAGMRIRVPLDGTPVRLRLDATVRVVERTESEVVLEVVGPESERLRPPREEHDHPAGTGLGPTTPPREPPKPKPSKPAKTREPAWVQDVCAAIATFRETDDVDVAIALPHHELPPRHCAACGGSIFYRMGDCATCKPIVLWSPYDVAQATLLRYGRVWTGGYYGADEFIQIAPSYTGQMPANPQGPEDFVKLARVWLGIGTYDKAEAAFVDHRVHPALAQILWDAIQQAHAELPADPRRDAYTRSELRRENLSKPRYEVVLSPVQSEEDVTVTHWAAEVHRRVDGGHSTDRGKRPVLDVNGTPFVVGQKGYGHSRAYFRELVTVALRKARRPVSEPKPTSPRASP